MRKSISRAAYYRRNKSTVAHFEMECHYMTWMMLHDTKWHVTEKKPPGCTLCDACQNIEKKRRKK